jgi:hypothetical protein
MTKHFEKTMKAEKVNKKNSVYVILNEDFDNVDGDRYFSISDAKEGIQSLLHDYHEGPLYIAEVVLKALKSQIEFSEVKSEDL